MTNFNIQEGYNSFIHQDSDFHLILRYTNHPEDSDLIELGEDNRVLSISRIQNKNNSFMPIGNTSLLFSKKNSIKKTRNETPIDIFKDFLQNNLNTLHITGSISIDYIRDIGTKERYESEISNYKKKISKPYKVVFKPSTREGKKKMAIFYDIEGNKIKTTHFGAAGMSDYTKHKDPERKKVIEKQGYEGLNRKFDKERLLDLLDELKDLGVEAISIISVGEPLIFPGIDEVIDKAVKLKFKLALTSNFSVPMKKDLIENLTSFSWLRWSMNGGSKNVYLDTNNPIGKGKDVAFERTCENIKKLVEIVFSNFGLDFNKYIEIDETLIRKGDPKSIISNPRKIRDELGWSNNVYFEDLVQICLKSRINSLKS